MKQYLDLLRDVMQNGEDRGDRTGTGTRSVFGRQLRFNLNEGFPLVTTKKMFMKGVIHELLWMISGDTNIKYLNDNGVHIWDEWADENGDLGPVYGKQWRNWAGMYGETDQLANVIERIKTNPDCRRLIVSSWNVDDLDDMALMPCHCFFQFYVANRKLSCNILVRSNDLFLGCPMNIAFYALLTHMVAQVCNLGVGELVYTIGDAHIYKNHFHQVAEQLTRAPFNIPTLVLNPSVKCIDDFKFEDILLADYVSHPTIKAPIAV